MTWSIAGSRISETGGDKGCQTRATESLLLEVTVSGDDEEGDRRGSESGTGTGRRAGGGEKGRLMWGFGIAGRLAMAVAGELANRMYTGRDEKEGEERAAESPQSDIIIGDEVDDAAGGWRLRCRRMSLGGLLIRNIPARQAN